MNSRERVKRAIHFNRPDRVPHYLPDGKENDILWLWTSKPKPIQEWTNEGDIDTMIDCYGTKFYRAKGGVLGRGEVLEPAITDISKQADYEIPDLLQPEFFEDAKQQISENNALDNPKYCLGVIPYSSLNEGTHNLTTLESMFIAYYEHPEELKAFVARLAALQKRGIKMLHDMGCDGVMGYDDWGLQTSLMVSQALLEEFFMPHYRENWAYAKELGMDVWLHSCGCITEILPLFADAGLTVIQQDQQENMGLENLAEKIGGKLAFWSPVDIQNTMINGSLDDIRAYAKKLIETLGAFDGGYISMAYSTPDDIDHTPEKLAAMSESFRENETLGL